MTTSRERVEAILRDDRADRLPVTFWRHWPGDDMDAAMFAQASVAFHRRFDLDIVKITPTGTYPAQDWGGRTRYVGKALGERDYLDRVVKRPEDWSTIGPVDPTRGAHGRMLETIRRVRAEVGPDVPILMTSYNPFNQARHLATEEVFMAHLRRRPEQVIPALDAICATTERFLAAAIEAGADGVYVSSPAASYAVMSEAEFRALAMPYDLRLFAAASAGWCNVVHFHRKRPMLGLAREYPVQAVCWEDRTSEPNLGEGKRLTGKGVFGGINHWGTLQQGSPAEVRAEALDAIAGCDGRGMVLSGGCTPPITVPEGNYLAARRAVDP